MGEIRQRDPIVASVLGSSDMGPGPKSNLALLFWVSPPGTQKPISASGKVDGRGDLLDLAHYIF